MSGSSELKNLLKNINPVLSDEEYIFAVLKDKGANDVELLNPFVTVHEDEGLTVVIERCLADKNKIVYESSYKRLTLRVFSSLDAVGLTAAVSTALAENNIPANIIAGFYHDHIFVPSSRGDEALNIINSLSQ